MGELSREHVGNALLSAGKGRVRNGTPGFHRFPHNVGDEFRELNPGKVEASELFSRKAPEVGFEGRAPAAPELASSFLIQT